MDIQSTMNDNPVKHGNGERDKFKIDIDEIIEIFNNVNFEKLPYTEEKNWRVQPLFWPK